MAGSSKALPLTASCLSPVPRFEIRAGQVRTLPVTWGSVVVFTGYSTTYNRLVTT